jgi:cation transport regulator ChaC
MSNHDYIFGFGSIMDTSTHSTWQTSESSSPIIFGSVVTISKRFGYQRQWNFRSSTGFTALGVSKSNDRERSDINGVLFRVPSDEMESFDKREVGYERIAIPLEMIQFHNELKFHAQAKQFTLDSHDRIWIYVPLPSHTMYADENHPLLQSYVDTVLRGCLEWGGESFAEQFILTTGGWGTYFLNDTPSSRRPWLYRKEYNTIDALLKKYSERTHYRDRSVVASVVYCSVLAISVACG